MGVTLSTGPTISAGPMLGGTGAPDYNLLAGPGVTYQGDTIPDPRFVMPGAADRIGVIKGHLDSPYILFVDAVPAAAGVATIAPAANAVSGTPLPLVTAAAAGITPAVPFYPFATPNTLTTSGVTLDFGFDKVSTTLGSTTVTVTAANIGLYIPGQWLIIGAGPGSSVAPLIAQITAVGTTTITISLPALATNANCPVGAGNVLDPYSLAPPTGWQPYFAAGVVAMYNPLEGLSRGVSVTGSASATGGAVKIVGYDIYNQLMSETITATAGATTTYGKKAFKHIMSATPQFTDAHNYSIGTSDVYGFALRSDKWEYCNFYVSGNFLSASTGWTAAVTTVAASTTGDVRGTLQVGTLGSLGSGASGGPMDGVKRIALFMTLPGYNITSATPANSASMYGVTQA